MATRVEKCSLTSAAAAAKDCMISSSRVRITSWSSRRAARTSSTWVSSSRWRSSRTESSSSASGLTGPSEASLSRQAGRVLGRRGPLRELGGGHPVSSPGSWPSSRRTVSVSVSVRRDTSAASRSRARVRSRSSRQAVLGRRRVPAQRLEALPTGPHGLDLVAVVARGRCRATASSRGRSTSTTAPSAVQRPRRRPRAGAGEPPAAWRSSACPARRRSTSARRCGEHPAALGEPGRADLEILAQRRRLGAGGPRGRRPAAVACLGPREGRAGVGLELGHGARSASRPARRPPGPRPSARAAGSLRARRRPPPVVAEPGPLAAAVASADWCRSGGPRPPPCQATRSPRIAPPARRAAPRASVGGGRGGGRRRSASSTAAAVHHAWSDRTRQPGAAKRSPSAVTTTRSGAVEREVDRLLPSGDPDGPADQRVEHDSATGAAPEPDVGRTSSAPRRGRLAAPGPAGGRPRRRGASERRPVAPCAVAASPVAVPGRLGARRRPPRPRAAPAAASKAASQPSSISTRSTSDPTTPSTPAQGLAASRPLQVVQRPGRAPRPGRRCGAVPARRSSAARSASARPDAGAAPRASASPRPRPPAGPSAPPAPPTRCRAGRAWPPPPRLGAAEHAHARVERRRCACSPARGADAASSRRLRGRTARASSAARASAPSRPAACVSAASSSTTGPRSAARARPRSGSAAASASASRELGGQARRLGLEGGDHVDVGRRVEGGRDGTAPLAQRRPQVPRARSTRPCTRPSAAGQVLFAVRGELGRGGRGRLVERRRRPRAARAPRPCSAPRAAAAAVAAGLEVGQLGARQEAPDGVATRRPPSSCERAAAAWRSSGRIWRRTSRTRSPRRSRFSPVAARRRSARSRRRRCLRTPAASSMMARRSSGRALSTVSSWPWPMIMCCWRPTPESDSSSWMSSSRQGCAVDGVLGVARSGTGSG